MGVKDVSIGMSKLPIKEFKLTDMCRNPSIVLIAKKGSGKSVVTRAIVQRFKDVPVGVVLSKTDRFDGFYGDFVKDSYIYYEYKSSIIQRLLTRQEIMMEKNKMKKAQGKRIDDRAFLVMDDCLSDRKIWMKDTLIDELLYNGRHYHIMYILTMQYSLGITPNLRTNFDYIFLLADDFQSNIKRIYDHYAGMFPTFDAFRQVFRQLTADFGCMVIVNRGARADFLDKVFYFKADVKEKIEEVGCKQYKRYHDNNYNQNWRKKMMDEKNKFDINEYCNDKKKSKAPIKIDIAHSDMKYQKNKMSKHDNQYQDRRQVHFADNTYSHRAY